MVEYGSALIREIERVDKTKRKQRKYTQYVGVIKYKVANPDYIEKPEGEDTRKPNQKRPEIWKQKTKNFNPKIVNTKSKANTALQQWRAELEAVAAESEAASVTVPDYVDLFLQPPDGAKNPSPYKAMLRDATEIEASTLKGYKTLAKIIRTEFEGVRLGDLTDTHIEKWIAKMKRAEYSIATQQKAYKLLNRACKYAVKKNDIPYNPVSDAKKPKTPKASPNAMTDEDIKRLYDLLDNMPVTPFCTAVYLGMNMGLREGEICGLRWADVDLVNEQLFIRRAIGRSEGEYSTYIKAPKTEESERVLPIGEEMLSVLRKRYRRMSEDLEEPDITPTPEVMAGLYVVGFVDGRYMNPGLLSKEWKSFAKMNELKGVQGRICTFHDTRHTFATKAIADGVDAKTVADYLGHKNAFVTLNIYASKDMKAKRQGVAKVENVYRNL